MKKRRALAYGLMIAFLLCSGCGRKAAGGLERLARMRPGQGETVVVEYMTPLSPAPGQRFALSRAEYPELVEAMIGTPLTQACSTARKACLLREAEMPPEPAELPEKGSAGLICGERGRLDRKLVLCPQI